MQEQTVGSSELSASSQLEPPKSTEAALEKAPSVTAQSALATSMTTTTHERQLQKPCLSPSPPNKYLLQMLQQEKHVIKYF